MAVWASGLGRLRRAGAWVLSFPLMVVWIVLRVLMIPVYWLLVIVPLLVVQFTRWGDDGTWERWADRVTAVADSPLHLAAWIGGKEWNE